MYNARRLQSKHDWYVHQDDPVKVSPVKSECEIWKRLDAAEDDVNPLDNYNSSAGIPPAGLVTQMKAGQYLDEMSDVVQTGACKLK